MAKYQNSECEEHKDVETSAPVCIVCMDQKISELHALLDEAAQFVRAYKCQCNPVATREEAGILLKRIEAA